MLGDRRQPLPVRAAYPGVGRMRKRYRWRRNKGDVTTGTPRRRPSRPCPSLPRPRQSVPRDLHGARLRQVCSCLFEVRARLREGLMGGGELGAQGRIALFGARLSGHQLCAK